MHERLLMQYATLHVEEKNRQNVGVRIQVVRRIATGYLPTARVWSKIFSLEAEKGEDDTEGTAAFLQEVFELWRKKNGLEATVAWGRWLLRHGRGKDATAIVVRTRSWLDQTERMELEKQWTAILEEEVEVEE